MSMKTETESENYYEITWEGVLYGSNGSEDMIKREEQRSLLVKVVKI